MICSELPSIYELQHPLTITSLSQCSSSVVYLSQSVLDFSSMAVSEHYDGAISSDDLIQFSRRYCNLSERIHRYSETQRHQLEAIQPETQETKHQCQELRNIESKLKDMSLKILGMLNNLRDSGVYISSLNDVYKQCVDSANKFAKENTDKVALFQLVPPTMYSRLGADSAFSLTERLTSDFYKQITQTNFSDRYHGHVSLDREQDIETHQFDQLISQLSLQIEELVPQNGGAVLLGLSEKLKQWASKTVASFQKPNASKTSFNDQDLNIFLNRFQRLLLNDFSFLTVQQRQVFYQDCVATMLSIVSHTKISANVSDSTMTIIKQILASFQEETKDNKEIMKQLVTVLGMFPGQEESLLAHVCAPLKEPLLEAIESRHYKQQLSLGLRSYDSQVAKEVQHFIDQHSAVGMQGLTADGLNDLLIGKSKIMTDTVFSEYMESFLGQLYEKRTDTVFFLFKFCCVCRGQGPFMSNN